VRYISDKVLNSYKAKAKQLVSTQKELDALKKSSINPNLYRSVKKSLSQTKTKLDLASKKSSTYSRLYVGLKEKYSAAEDVMTGLRDKITRQEKSMKYIKDRSEAFERSYRQMLKQSATSRTTITKMKMNHQRQMLNLSKKLEEVQAEADSANQQVTTLLKQIDEIEKNEKMARENSLTQALINTRDVVFDNTIATNLSGVGEIGENTSRGLAFLTGLALVGFMVSRVD